jgi:hypothetical protein
LVSGEKTNLETKTCHLDVTSNNDDITLYTTQ